MKTEIKLLSENEIREYIKALPEDAIISDSINIITRDSAALMLADEILISTADKSAAIKREREMFSLEEEYDTEESEEEYDYSPYSDGDKDSTRNFCDITPEGAKLEELLNITIGDIIHLRKENALIIPGSYQEDGFLFMHRIPSAIFEAMDLTRAEYSDSGRLIRADLLMLLKPDLLDSDRDAVLSIIFNAVTDILEMPGDSAEEGFIWNAGHYRITDHIIKIKERSYAALSFCRD